MQIWSSTSPRSYNISGDSPFKAFKMLLFLTLPDSRIHSWESWFIFNLWNKQQSVLYLIQGNKIIIAACKQHIGKIHGKFLSYGQSHNMALYILERPSSWDTSRIRLSWPRSRGRLSLLLVLFPQVYSCLLWPTQCLAICSNSSYFALNPFLAY